MRTALIILSLFAPFTAFAALNDGLVGYWPLDTRDTVWTSPTAGSTFDRGGTSNGTLTSMAQSGDVIAGKVGQAFIFNGSTKYISLGTSDSIGLLNNTAFSVVVWIYPRTLGQGNLGRVLFRRNSTGTGTGINLNMQATNNIEFSIDGGTKFDISTSDNTIPFYTWKHVAVSYDGSDVAANTHIYLNGVETTYKVQANGVTQGATTGQPSYIGIRGDIARAFDGYIDDVHVYNRALSGGEISQLYRQGARNHYGSWFSSFIASLFKF